MMTNAEFDLWAIRAGIPVVAKAYIQRVRTSPPSRRPGNKHGSNVIGAYPSRKMGLAINFESHKCELPAIHLLERDPDVLEYWEQPRQIKISYAGKNGKIDCFLYTPDFLVLRTDGAVLQEWKMEEHLVALAIKSPNRYHRENEGWSCPPAIAAAEELGLGFEVHSAKEFSWALQRNITFLEDYWRKEHAVTEAITTQILEIVAANPAIPLSELKPLAKNAGASVDDLFALIACERIYVDLAATPLTGPDEVRIFANRELAEAYVAINEEPLESMPGTGTSLIRLEPGSTLLWNGVPLRVQVLGETKVFFTNKDGEVVEFPNEVVQKLVKDGEVVGAPDFDAANNVARNKAMEILATASPEDLAQATRRRIAIEPYLNANLPRKGLPRGSIPAATLRRWRKDYRNAKATSGFGYIGLLPKKRVGNKLERIEPEVQKAVDEKIALVMQKPKNLRATIVYGAILDYCLQNNLPCPSRKTIRLKVKKLPEYERVLAQSGKRKAYQVKDFYYELVYTTPRHGERPWEIGHIDHTLTDLEIICPKTNQNLGKLWMTFLIDAYSRRILAVYVTFEEPSYRSCMAVLRICVKRHGRLPQTIVVDNGPEFRSIYFQALVTMYERTWKLRPRAQPRGGSPLETLFNITNAQLIHSLQGNTQATKDVRTVTKSHDPKRLAIWTTERFYERLCHWAYEVYDTCPHGTLKETPRSAYLTGMANSGDRPQQLIAYDECFKMMTLPTTKRKKAQIIPRYGVKIHGIYYWNNDFRKASCHRKRVPVRYEPFDIGTAYALLDGRWVRCISQHYRVFRGMSEKILMHLLTRYRQLAKQHGRNVEAVTAKKLAETWRRYENDEEVLTLQKRQIESAAALRLVDREGASIAPDSPSICGNAMTEETTSDAAAVAASADDVPQEKFTSDIAEDEYEDFES
jgi:putative transposase